MMKSDTRPNECARRSKEREQISRVQCPWFMRSLPRQVLCMPWKRDLRQGKVNSIVRRRWLLVYRLRVRVSRAGLRHANHAHIKHRVSVAMINNGTERHVVDALRHLMDLQLGARIVVRRLRGHVEVHRRVPIRRSILRRRIPRGGRWRRRQGIRVPTWLVLAGDRAGAIGVSILAALELLRELGREGWRVSRRTLLWRHVCNVQPAPKRRPRTP